MKIFVKRNDDDGLATLGTLTTEEDQPGASPFPSMTLRSLEDTYRDEKVEGETRIPAGTYRVKFRDEGSMTQKYARRFPDMHRGMLWLQDVPGFEWVYIHIGNTRHDTAGCILVGETTGVNLENAHTIVRSGPAYKALYRKCLKAWENDEAITITIVDESEMPVQDEADDTRRFSAKPARTLLVRTPDDTHPGKCAGVDIIDSLDPTVEKFCTLLVPDSSVTPEFGPVVVQRVLDALNVKA